MLSDLLTQQIKRILENSFNYTAPQQNLIMSFLSAYHPGQWIYPGALKRNLHITIEEAYRILEKLADEGLLEGWYEYRCSNCQTLAGLARFMNELPPTFRCENCGSLMITLENTIKIYKVV